MTSATGFSTDAIALRRVEYGDHDLIVTFFTRDRGRLSAIAKNAKKSTRRFGGRLELFAAVRAICNPPRRGGLLVLQEVELIRPHAGIRTRIDKTAYASYWAELVTIGTEEAAPSEAIYELLAFVLDSLSEGRLPAMHLSILFQMRYLMLAGLCPNLEGCCACRSDLEGMPRKGAVFDLKRGGLTCDRVECGASGTIHLSKGTIKQLRWLESGDLSRALRSRFTAETAAEAEAFLEGFTVYHLGKRPKSLSVLRQIRTAGASDRPGPPGRARKPPATDR
ncbi:MAG: DNA repair protein RecO [Desulfobacterales bacterium]